MTARAAGNAVATAAGSAPYAIERRTHNPACRWTPWAMKPSLRWRDAWAWQPGRNLALPRSSANRVDLQLQRPDDGRDSWMLGPPEAAPTLQLRQLADLVKGQHVALAAGHTQLQGAALALQLDGRVNQRPATDCRYLPYHLPTALQSIQIALSFVRRKQPLPFGFSHTRGKGRKASLDDDS